MLCVAVFFPACTAASQINDNVYVSGISTGETVELETRSHLSVSLTDSRVFLSAEQRAAMVQSSSGLPVV